MITFKEDISGIYKITNIINGKVYIGQSCHINRRFMEHVSALTHNSCYNKHLQRSWNKYGQDAFRFEIVEECPVELLNEREMHYVQVFDSKLNGYNQTDGGGGCRGYICSDETCRKLSEALRGRPKSPEVVQQMRERAIEWYKHHDNPRSIKVVCLNTGEVFANASRAADQYGIASAADIRGCCNGYTHYAGTNSCKEHLVWAKYNDYIKMTADEIQDRVHNANKSTSGANNHKARRVICVTTGEVFGCIKEAAEHHNVNINSIVACCKNKRKHAGGMEWQYYVA